MLCYTMLYYAILYYTLHIIGVHIESYRCPCLWPNGSPNTPTEGLITDHQTPRVHKGISPSAVDGPQFCRMGSNLGIDTGLPMTRSY